MSGVVDVLDVNAEEKNVTISKEFSRGLVQMVTYDAVLRRTWKSTFYGRLDEL